MHNKYSWTSVSIFGWLLLFDAVYPIRFFFPWRPSKKYEGFWHKSNATLNSFWKASILCKAPCWQNTSSTFLSVMGFCKVQQIHSFSSLSYSISLAILDLVLKIKVKSLNGIEMGLLDKLKETFFLKFHSHII